MGWIISGSKSSPDATALSFYHGTHPQTHLGHPKVFLLPLLVCLFCFLNGRHEGGKNGIASQLSLQWLVHLVAYSGGACPLWEQNECFISVNRMKGLI